MWYCFDAGAKKLVVFRSHWRYRLAQSGPGSGTSGSSKQWPTEGGQAHKCSQVPIGWIPEAPAGAEKSDAPRVPMGPQEKVDDLY
eukprot:4327225-Pyramimonas_sp.AAC.1